MKLFESPSKPLIRDIIITLMIFIIILIAFIFGFSNVQKKNKSENFALMNQGIERAVVNCYAIEGAYPPNFLYLEEHYGIVIDHTKYAVDYQMFGSNVKPVIQVIQREDKE